MSAGASCGAHGWDCLCGLVRIKDLQCLLLRALHVRGDDVPAREASAAQPTKFGPARVVRCQDRSARQRIGGGTHACMPTAKALLGIRGIGCTELKARSRPKVCLQVHAAHLSPAGGLAWPISTCCSLQAHHCALVCSACVQATIAWPTGTRRPQPAPEPVVPVVRFERDQLATRLHEPLQVTHLDLHATHRRHVACRHRERHSSSMAEATAECEPLRGVLSQASNTRGGMDPSGSTLRNRIQSHWVLPRKVSKVKRNHHSVAVRSNAKRPNNMSWAVHSREQGDAHMAGRGTGV